jgi:hypothetical protein
MKVGKPKRVYRVEPLESPVPARKSADRPPQPAPKAPKPVAPAR